MDSWLEGPSKAASMSHSPEEVNYSIVAAEQLASEEPVVFVPAVAEIAVFAGDDTLEVASDEDAVAAGSTAVDPANTVPVVD